MTTQKITNAMVGSGEAVKGVYEGEYNAAGWYEGLSTMRYVDGSVC